MEKMDQHDPRIADVIRRAAQNTRQQEKRLAAIFGKQEIPEVTGDTLTIYFDYLKQHLDMPCLVTGIEDMGCFAWEEYYTFGPGSKRKYEKLKKKRASYTDTFELLSFSDDYDADYGLVVNVRRLSDKKKFALTLSDLKAADEKSKNHELLDDFSVWFVNWR